jgi:WD40 repeat protein
VNAAKAAGRPNPYVGPVAYLQGQILYGRRGETMELADLMISRRIVLLYSPSGAGKTSLIRASLPRELERRAPRQLRLSPVLRVNYAAADVTANRFVLSALRSFEDSLPEGERLKDAELAPFTVARYLYERWGPMTSPGRKLFDVLIFDQFEEIFTLDPIEREAKREFFRQVGEALGRRADNDADEDDGPPRFVRWALFAMREDYIAELDDYRELVPTELSTRYRLNLLDRDQAREAIQSPAADAGVTFADDAVDEVLDELTTVLVTRPGGRVQEQRGNFVEPVQLQVVCRHLWSQLVQPGTTHIAREAIENLDRKATAHGEVDAALRGYFDVEVSDAAGGQKGRERVIREWIERSLITTAKLRNQVLREGGSGVAVAKGEVDALVDSHVLRSEKRGGREWVELTHDRMVPPILASNRDWFSAHLSPLQRQARVWEDARRLDGYLLTGRALREAEEWAQTHTGEVQESEQAFLAASRTQRRRTLWMRIGMVAFLLFLGVSGLRGHLKNEQLADLNARAVAQEQLGAVRLKLAVADRRVRSNYREALEHAMEAERQIDTALTASRSEAADGGALRASSQALIAKARSMPGWVQWLLAVEPRPDVEDAVAGLQGEYRSVDGSLLEALRDAPPVVKRYPGHHDAVRFVAFSGDGKRIVSSGYDGKILVRDRASGATLGAADTKSMVYAFAFDPGTGLVASGDASGGIRIWRVGPGGALSELATLNADRKVHAQRITGLAFGADGRTLAASSWDRRISLWDMTVPERGTLLAELDGRQHDSTIYALAFDKGGRLATVDWAGGAIVWEGLPTPAARDARPRWTELSAKAGHDRPVALNAVAFSADGRLLVAGGHDGSVMLWELDRIAQAPKGALRDELRSGKRLRGLGGHSASVFGVAFSPDGATFASAGIDKTLIVWNAGAAGRWQAGDDLPVVRRVTQLPERLYGLGYHPQDARLIAAGGTHHVQLIDDDGPASPIATSLRDSDRPTALHPGGWEGSALVRDGRTLFASRGDEVWHWTLPEDLRETPKERGVVVARHDKLNRMAAASDGRLFATAGAAPGDGKGGELVLWRAGAGGQFERVVVHAAPSRFSALAFNRDGRLLAAASDEAIYLWDLGASGAPRLVFEEPLGRRRVRTLAFSPAEDLFAAAGAGMPLMLWRVSGDRVTLELQSEPARQIVINAVQFAPDGKTLVTGDEDMRAIEWKVAKPLVPSPPAIEHERGVVSVARAGSGPRAAIFAADKDGDLLVRFGSDEQGVLTPDERHLRPLLSGLRRPTYVSANAAGDRLVTTGDMLLVWDLRPERLRLEACRITSVPDENGNDPCAAYSR